MPAPPAFVAPTTADRVRRGIRRPANWLQLARFCTVGAAGYAINLATFALCTGPFGLDYRLAATVAFLVAVTNNFAWNRRWTFSLSGGRRRVQALRFLAVSGVAFVLNVVLLQLLVDLGGVPTILAQALAVAAATPLAFAGNKLWTFDGRRAQG
jgi:dolichol-phosphate mannosyltransferase